VDARTEDGRIVRFVGAVEILKGAVRNYAGPDQALGRALRRKHLEISGEPAQVTNCPCCTSLLAVPEKGLGSGRHTLHFHHDGGRAGNIPVGSLPLANLSITVDSAHAVQTASMDYPNALTTVVRVTISAGETLTAQRVDEWWEQVVSSYHGPDTRLFAARPCRPGYFIVRNGNDTTAEVDFEIFCPNPECQLNSIAWAEQVPFGRSSPSLAPRQTRAQGTGAGAQRGLGPLSVVEDLQWQQGSTALASRRTPLILGRVPISAYTVDEQVYSRCPSVVIATVDKFARLSFDPRGASIFGNVTHYHSCFGYYRSDSAPQPRLSPTPRSHPPGGPGGRALHTPVSAHAPPELIIQDELHLIDGPLGSMVGLYEIAIDELCTRRNGSQRTSWPKYIASTATIQSASEQVQSVFRRSTEQFPPSALSADDRFFAQTGEAHPVEEQSPGRLYVGICAPGKGAQTPIIRIWSSLLESAYRLNQSTPGARSDHFWTLVGYFNAIRELAGASSLYRQDIPERMEFRFGRTTCRPIDPDAYVELSGRTNSLELPAILADLTRSAPEGFDAALTTSMFGTGVDIDRLGLMVVHGQPKSSASYIQATGRVGRQAGGLVVTFLRAARPRDLDHYEYFTGYHRSLYKHVEPVTVAPFSPRARDRAFGPICVAALRQASTLSGAAVDDEWRVQQRSTTAERRVLQSRSSHGLAQT
jgi:hypothetical protein